MRIKPLRGYRYGIGRERDVSKVVAPPYDQISDETQAWLYAASPDNVVRISYPREPSGGGDRYLEARATLDRWLAEAAWTPEDRPAIYPYEQTYRVDGHELRRQGFIALGEASDYARGVVRPHERTHSGPKADRLRLLQATGADTGLLFMLTADPGGRLLEATTGAGEPVAVARDLRGELHRLWRITDAAAIARVQALMADAEVTIADGHHRYETAVEYARHHPAAADKLMAFFSLQAPGLTIFPNHRLVHGVAGFDLARFLEAARAWFDVAPLGDPLGFHPQHRALAVVAGPAAAVLRLRDEAFERIAWPPGTSR
ncbi:MAG TPA: DUF1015 domain-containing protein, partial [Methylomirabilota bacterium]|nr:DUF1015 domain-containing protein [Methylomirabilota bacterium]